MSTISSLKLKTRLSLVIATLAIGFVIFGAWSFATLDRLKVNGALYQRIVQGKDLIADILPPPEYIIESYLVTLQMLHAFDNAEVDVLVKRFDQLRSDYSVRHQYWAEQSLGPDFEDVFLQQAHQPAMRFYEIAEKDFIPAIRGGDKTLASAALVTMREAYEKHRHAIEKVVSMSNARNKQDEQKGAQQITAASWGMGVVLVLSMGTAIFLMVWISRDLLRQLGGEPDEAVRVAHRIAAGDLSGHGENQAGLLGSLSEMRNKLRELIEQIVYHSTQLSTAAEELSVASTQSSVNVRRLQSEADQVVTAVEEMSSTSKEVANSATGAAYAARQATQQSHAGREIVASARSNVGGLARKVENASDVINKLDQESAKIGGVVDVISGIAEQTNLLALNAAIEAARAGEQGRGFAVVADEVRNLASRTQQSTKEIHQIIQQLKAGISAAVVTMNEARGTASESMNHMELADGALAQIAQTINNISAMSDQIATAMKEQNTTTCSMAANMTDIHHATEEASVSTGQISAATQELAKLAVELNGMTQRFRFSE